MILNQRGHNGIVIWFEHGKRLKNYSNEVQNRFLLNDRSRMRQNKKAQSFLPRNLKNVIYMVICRDVYRTIVLGPKILDDLVSPDYYLWYFYSLCTKPGLQTIPWGNIPYSKCLQRSRNHSQYTNTIRKLFSYQSYTVHEPESGLWSIRGSLFILDKLV